MTTWYATNSLVGTVWQEMSETSPGTDALSNPQVGWTVGQTAGVAASSFDSGTEKAWATQAGQPDGTLDATAGDALRTTSAYSGTFATGTWTFNFTAIANTLGGVQDGRILFRLLRSANADGSGATEITSGSVGGSAITNLATTAQQTSSGTTSSISSFTVNNEYIFCQLAWEIASGGAGAMSTSDVIMRIGTTATRLVSPTFTVGGTDTDVRVSFPTPQSAPSTGAGNQEFRVLVRKKGAGSNPSVTVYLYESGSQVGSALVGPTTVSDTTGTVISAPWDAASLSTASGANVECRVAGTGVAGGTLEVGAIEWNKLPQEGISLLLPTDTVQRVLMRR